MDFIDYIWTDYKRLQVMPELKKMQIHSLYYTGLYEGDEGGEYTFVPTKLMEALEKKIDRLYEKINVVDSSVMIENEIYYTSKIEGANTTIMRTAELIHNEADVNTSNPDTYFSEMMVLGGFKATKYMNIKGNRVDEDILISMWDILVKDCCKNLSAQGEKYRVEPIGIGNNGEIIYKALSPDKIDGAMKDWISFYNSETLNNHPYIKAALLHIAYERIHPFCDGNGRSGRLLMTNYLIGQGFDKCKAVAFSKQISKNYTGYSNGFILSNNAYMDCTPFIEYMLQVFSDAYEEVLTYEKNDVNMQDVDNYVAGIKTVYREAKAGSIIGRSPTKPIDVLQGALDDVPAEYKLQVLHVLMSDGVIKKDELSFPSYRKMAEYIEEQEELEADNEKDDLDREMHENGDT